MHAGSIESQRKLEKRSEGNRLIGRGLGDGLRDGGSQKLVVRPLRKAGGLMSRVTKAGWSKCCSARTSPARRNVSSRGQRPETAPSPLPLLPVRTEEGGAGGGVKDYLPVGFAHDYPQRSPSRGTEGQTSSSSTG